MAEILRSFTYDENEDPVMVLSKKVPPVHNRFRRTPKPPSYAIRQVDAWKFSEEHNELFIDYMFGCCNHLCGIFGLGLVTSQKMASMAAVIQEGIEDLIRMKPITHDSAVVGEAEITLTPLNGGAQQKFTTDLKEEVFHIE